ncbi:MAG: hypothetical protein NT092_14870 [Bacteroidia bacterium]|nr:hypothetical protein [Bacteroidia bacterium]
MDHDNEKPDTQNPLGMIPDRYDGKTFVLPPTPCTDERRLFLKRTNEILGFLFVTCLSYHEYMNHFEKLVPNLPFKDRTPMKIKLKSKFAMMPANRVLAFTKEAVDVLARQVFVMIYGSFETYLYGLFERSYAAVGVVENTLETSLDILMKKRWDGKFCKMGVVFGFEYMAGELARHFSNFKMDFQGKIFNNPLDFLDELTQVRHRIVHASSIIGKDQLIFIDIDVLPELVNFFYHLTDYTDEIFAKRFGYSRAVVNPGEA